MSIVLSLYTVLSIRANSPIINSISCYPWKYILSKCWLENSLSTWLLFQSYLVSFPPLLLLQPLCINSFPIMISFYPLSSRPEILTRFSGSRFMALIHLDLHLKKHYGRWGVGSLIHGCCIYVHRRLACSFHMGQGNARRQLLFWFGLRGD